MSPFFSRKNLKYYEENIFIPQSNKLIDKITTYSNDKIFNIQELYYCCTLDTILKILFDKHPEFIDYEQQPEFAKAFDWLQMEISNRLKFPFWKLRKFVTKTHNTYLSKKSKRIYRPFM